MKIKLLAALISLLCLSSIASAQIASGGVFRLEKSVIATGGGTNSNGAFSVAGTTGQNTAGAKVTVFPFTLNSGFWSPVSLPPTAATVSIGGRVTTASGNGIRNAVITLTDSNGRSKSVVTGSFGYYCFIDVEVGNTYLLSVNTRRFVFSNSSQFVTINEERDDINFSADE